jgi:hypothetical protein
MDATSHAVASCKKCNPGFYQDETGASYCKASTCADGKYVPATNANEEQTTSTGGCTDCAAGTFFSVAQFLQSTVSETWPATTPTTAAHTARVEPDICLDNTCVAGKYFSGPHPGYEVEGASALNQLCLPCAAGKFTSAAAQTVCSNCAAGKYQDQTGQASCTDCTAGNGGLDTTAASVMGIACIVF